MVPEVRTGAPSRSNTGFVIYGISYAVWSSRTIWPNLELDGAIDVTENSFPSFNSPWEGTLNTLPANTSYTNSWNLLNPALYDAHHFFGQLEFDSASAFTSSCFSATASTQLENTTNGSNVEDSTSRFSSENLHTNDCQMTSSVAMIAYHPTRSGRLAPRFVEGGKRPRGRTGPLSANKRQKTAVMRGLGACKSCRSRKVKVSKWTHKSMEVES